MVETITAVGIVISSMAISEYDKRLVILTKELGKITAFARGARKPTSPFLGGSQCMAFGEFSLYRGRNSYTVTSMKISDYFSSEMKNADSMYMGMYFLELADYYGREGIESSDTLKLLYLSMRALGRGVIPARLVRCVYEMKMLVINGEYPELFKCGNCGLGDELDYFDIDHNTILCARCHGNIPQGQKVDDSTVYALQFIVSSPVEKLFTFKVTDQVLQNMEKIIRAYINEHIERKFNSLDFIEN